ncbi:protein kinase domain-containing protein [Streptomyces filamentosus]
MASEDPERIGAYWLASRLGEGGQGVVYEAYDLAGRRVAVKVLHRAADEQTRRLFRREAQAASRVASYCTARILEVSSDADEPYLVVEYVPGPSLGARVRDGGPVTADDAVRLGIGIATGLAAIHRAGVVHRDLKPGNVLLGPDGPRIIDFGIARAVDMSVTADAWIMGTFGYMAPEVLSGERAGEAADVFAWGATVLYAVTGREPFRGATAAETAYRTTRHEPDLGEVPAVLRSLVGRALAKDPARRPGAAEILLSLLGAPAGAPEGERPSDPRIALLRAGVRRAGPADGGSRPATEPVPALGERAEAAYGSLPGEARAVAHELLLRLVVPGAAEDGSEDSVRPVGRAELLEGRPAAEQRAMSLAMTVLTESGVLLPLPDGGVRAAGAALLPAWPRLRGWVEADRSGTAVRLWLTRAALAWQDNGRRSEDLPHGSALEECRRWLPTAPLHLRPNPLEVACLDASRLAADRAARRRRRLLAGLSVVTVLALLAGGAAWLQSREVDRRRTEATARTIAQSAETLRGSDPVPAMLLGLAAWRTARVPETRAALIAAAAQRERQVTNMPVFYEGESTRRALTADGRAALFLSPAGLRVVGLYGKDRGRTLWAEPEIDEALLISSLDLSEDNSLIAVTDREADTVRVLSTRDGHELAPPLPLRGRTQEGITDKGHLVLAGPGEGGEEVLVTASGRTVAVVPAGAEVSPDGRHLVSCASGGLAVRPVEGTGPAVPIERPGWAVERGCGQIRFSPDGRFAALEGESVDLVRELSVYDLVDRRLVGEVDSVPAGYRFSSGGRYIVASTDAGGVEVWSSSGGDLPVVRISGAASGNRAGGAAAWSEAALDEESRTLLQWVGDTVHHLDLSEALTDAPANRNSVTARALSPDGRTALVSERFSPDLSGQSDRFQGRLVDPGTGRDRGPAFPQKLHVAQDLPRTALGDLSDDGRLVAFTETGPGGRYGVTLRDASRGRDVLHWDSAEESGPSWLDLSPGGSHIAVLEEQGGVPSGEGSTLRVFDVRARKEVLSARGTEARGAFSPDGRLFLTTDGLVLDLADGRRREVAGLRGAVRRVAFSPDGRTAAVFKETGLVELWDGGVTRRLAVMSSSVSRGGGRGGQDLDRFVFSRDGKLLAAVVNGDTVQLWDTENRLALGDPLPMSGRGVEAMAFAGNVLWTVAGTRGHALDLSPESLAARICRQAGRDLTQREWDAYLPDVERRKLC